ncbi:hypothetical protein ACVR1G_00750 [Streptococcus dentasini]
MASGTSNLCNFAETAIYVERKNAGMLDDHSVAGWQFDNDGNLVDKVEDKYYNLIQAS